MYGCVVRPDDNYLTQKTRYRTRFVVKQMINEHYTAEFFSESIQALHRQIFRLVVVNLDGCIN